MDHISNEEASLRSLLSLGGQHIWRAGGRHNVGQTCMCPETLHAGLIGLHSLQNPVPSEELLRPGED